MKPATGTVLGGRYRLVSRVAVGGMGEVWVAHDDSLKRDVAVKVLREEFAGDAGFLERFRTEARNSAGLSHPNIAALYDYGEQGGSGFLVMELVLGEPMSDLLDRQPVLPTRRLLPILAQTARALHAAHAGGVVHRDVKPGNILIARTGQVKITDFGISMAVNQVPMTASGMVMGTAQYLSPEQAIGRAATPASDVYSLGIVAYEALVGNRPFTGPTAVDIAVAHVNTPVPPMPGEIDPDLSSLVMRMLEKEPERRPRSAASLARALDDLADRTPPGGIPAPYGRHARPVDVVDAVESGRSAPPARLARTPRPKPPTLSGEVVPVPGRDDERAAAGSAGASPAAVPPSGPAGVQPMTSAVPASPVTPSAPATPAATGASGPAATSTLAAVSFAPGPLPTGSLAPAPLPAGPPAPADLPTFALAGAGSPGSSPGGAVGAGSASASAPVPTPAAARPAPTFARDAAPQQAGGTPSSGAVAGGSPSSGGTASNGRAPSGDGTSSGGGTPSGGRTPSSGGAAASSGGGVAALREPAPESPPVGLPRPGAGPLARSLPTPPRPGTPAAASAPVTRASTTTGRRWGHLTRPLVALILMVVFALLGAAFADRLWGPASAGADPGAPTVVETLAVTSDGMPSGGAMIGQGRPLP